MRNYENGAEKRYGNGSRRSCGGDLIVPGCLMKDSGLRQEDGLRMMIAPGMVLIIGPEENAVQAEKAASSMRSAMAALELPGLLLTADVLEDAGFSAVADMDDFVITMDSQERRIIIEEGE